MYESRFSLNKNCLQNSGRSYVCFNGCGWFLEKMSRLRYVQYLAGRGILIRKTVADRVCSNTHSKMTFYLSFNMDGLKNDDKKGKSCVNNKNTYWANFPRVKMSKSQFSSIIFNLLVDLVKHIDSAMLVTCSLLHHQI